MVLKIRKMSTELILLINIFSVVSCRQAQLTDTTFNDSVLYDEFENVVATIPTNQTHSDGSYISKTILLNRVIINDQFLENQTKLLAPSLLNTEFDYSPGIVPFEESPTAIYVDMQSVPVLDQGPYGTCVTFATTTILDKILNIGDVVSQQCILALNKELGNDYWSGAQNSLQILRPLRTHGLVEHSQCPFDYPMKSIKISKEDYSQIISKTYNVDKIIGHFIDPITLDIVKSALDKKHLVALGFGIKKDYSNIAVSGFKILIKGKRTFGGLWACQQEKSNNYCGTPNSGHEVVITGYDDAQQLLKIRNSWGTSVGDDGDFYMTYQFFNAMGFNGTEIFEL